MSWAAYLLIAACALALCLVTVFVVMHLAMYSLFGRAEEKPTHPRADLHLVERQTHQLSKAAPTPADLQAAARSRERAVRANAVNAALIDAGKDAHGLRTCPYLPGTQAAAMWHSTYDRVTADITAAEADAAA